jgi:hypothetical protein
MKGGEYKMYSAGKLGLKIQNYREDKEMTKEDLSKEVEKYDT